MITLRWYMDEKTSEALKQRTEERQKQALEALGDKWLCSAANRPHKAELRAQRAKLITQTPV